MLLSTLLICNDLSIKNQDINRIIKECNNNNGRSCNYLGYIYAKGIKVEKDLFRANNYFKKACDLNQDLACSFLALNYEYGKGTVKNLSKSIVYYKKSCNLGNGNACLSLAHIYDNEFNIDKGNEYYIKSCKQGVSKGCYIIGVSFSGEDDFMFKRKFNKKDIQKAIKYLEIGCGLHDKKCCQKLNEFN